MHGMIHVKYIDPSDHIFFTHLKTPSTQTSKHLGHQNNIFKKIMMMTKCINL